MFITPFTAQFVGEKLVVTGLYKDTLDVSTKVVRGDVVESIDGVPVADLIIRYLPLTPASNYATKLRNLTGLRGFLLRSNKPTATVELTRAGKRTTVELPRVPVSWSLYQKDQSLFEPMVGYKLLDNNIGYIYPARLTDKSIDSIKTLLHRTKGLVVDLRCYPGTFMPFTYGSWLKGKSSPFVDFTRGSIDIPGVFVRTGALENGQSNSDAYKGKVVIIVNETTQSNAEYTTMALQSIPGAVTIGSTTAGADGNVSAITLPGGLGTMISGISILYPDGTETQRKGVKIDRRMQPSIEGIRDGKDELLQAALGIINGR
jgi:C-terminal processing protease CtpA/Prc